MIAIAAQLFALLIGLTAIFQWLLAIGMPWGALTMGGRYSGKLPVPMRIAALLQSGLLICLALLILARANVAFPQLEPYAVIGAWLAVAVSGLALLLNLITPSKWERIVWAPVAALMLACAYVVASS